MLVGQAGQVLPCGDVDDGVVAVALGGGHRNDLVAVEQLDACHLAAPEAPGYKCPRPLHVVVFESRARPR